MCAGGQGIPGVGSGAAVKGEKGEPVSVAFFNFQVGFSDKGLYKSFRK